MSYDISNDIYIGAVGASAKHHFTNSEIVLNSIRGIFNADVIGNELPIDTFYVTIRYDPTGSAAIVYGTNTPEEAYITIDNNEYALWRMSPREFLQSVPYGTPVWWYAGGVLRAKGYASKMERTGKYAYKLTCISGVGLLGDKIHVGGLYTGETFGTVLASIVGSTFAYTLAANVAAVRVYGHLPYDFAKENLHRLLFSAGAVMISYNATYDYSIQYLDNTPSAIADNRISIGGSVDYQLPSNRAEIVEHGFFQTAGDETVVLYDNSGDQAVDHLTVIFDPAPAYNITASGSLTINESSVNHAVVTGTGTLTGKIYTHSRQIMILTDNPNGDPERTRRVTDNELVNTLNSRYVAMRVLAYYLRTRIIKNKLVLNNEKPGTYVTMMDAYGEPIAGYIQQMEFMPTSLNAANCQIADGFATDAYGNTFTKRNLYRYSQYPGGVTINFSINTRQTKALRIVLIGGGTGGQAGYSGEDGYRPESSVKNTDGDAPEEWDEDLQAYWTQYLMANGYADQQTPQGGAAGEPGSAGKLIVIDVDLSSLPNNTNYTIPMAAVFGAGGAGGSNEGALGSAGGNTTISFTAPTGESVSGTSADGVVIDGGWSDIMTGDVYLLPGNVGVRGGDGGLVDAANLNGDSGYPGMAIYAQRISAQNPIRALGYNGLAGQSVQNGEGGTGGAGYGYDGTDITKGGYTWTKGYNEEAYLQLPSPVRITQFPQAAAGGAGGGGAYGASGGKGGNATAEVRGDSIWGGNGGNGANAQPPSGVGIGGGGNGGNGGGAGGNGGGGYTYGANIRVYDYGVINYGTSSDGQSGRGGLGGSGSQGGRGGEGAIIIYS